jgi:hypothetical protein
VIEADFRREYDVSLAADLYTLSWREFRVLLRGLSAQSALASTLQAEREQKKSGPKRLEGNQFASFMAKAMGGGPPPE